MQGEFEKQVQQKMEELKFVPSEPVWLKVHARIKSEKERRRFFFILFFISVATAGILWWKSGGNNIGPTRQHSVAQNKTTPPDLHSITLPTKKNNREQEVEPTDSPLDKGTNSNDLLVTKHLNKNITGANKNDFVQSISPDKKGDVQTQDVQLPVRRPEKNEKTANTPDYEQKNNSVVTDQKPHVSDNPIPVQMNKPAANQPLTGEEKQNVIDKAVLDNKQNDTLIKVLLPVDTSIKKKVAKKNGWQKIVMLQAGYSSYTAGFLDSRLLFYSPSPASASQGPPYTPNNTSNGFSFSIGIGAKKMISKKFEFDVAVQFHYYSSHVKVGQHVDSILSISGSVTSFNNIANGYYRSVSSPGSTTTNDYTNKFGMIELPVSVHYQIFKKLPIKISAGASYGRLLKTDALTFNDGIGNYYYDKNNMHKNYFSLFSALQYDIKVKEKISLRIGPSLQYNLAPIEKTNYYSNTRLFFGGLKADILF